MGFCCGPVDVEPFQNLHCNHEMICISSHLVSGALRGVLHCNLWLPILKKGRTILSRKVQVVTISGTFGYHRRVYHYLKI